MELLEKPSFLLLLGGLAACLGTPPEEREPAVQGDYEDGDEEHRPGQPCLLCHGAANTPGGDQFVIAGTIYPDIDSDENDGIEFVDILITDANGAEIPARSNEAGNFMVEVGGSGAPELRSEGRTRISFTPEFPLEVEISRGSDDEQTMKTKIWREGSCSHCHGAAPDVDSVGRVYLFEDTP